MLLIAMDRMSVCLHVVVILSYGPVSSSEDAIVGQLI